MRLLIDAVLDVALNEIKNNVTEAYFINVANPADRAAAVAAAICSKTGLSGASFTGPANGDVSGRKLTINGTALNAMTPASNSTIHHLALCSASLMYAVLEIGPQVRQNTAQAGGASTITLDAGADAGDDAYNGYAIKIVSGTGAGQTRVISDYVGSTKVATVDSAWGTQPDNTSVFEIFGQAVTTAQSWDGNDQDMEIPDAAQS